MSGQIDLMVKVFAALKFNQIEGDYAEFGCHSAASFRTAYQASREAGYTCPLWAFDSFQGLPAQSCPEDWHPGWVEGAYRTSQEEFEQTCALLGMPRSVYRVVSGLYEDTLRRSDAAPGDLPARVSFAFIDCDLYSSVSTVLQFLSGRVGHGAVLAFDDYFCYSSKTLAGARLAAVEFATEHPNLHLAPYIQFGCHGMSFVVEDKQLWRGLDCGLVR